VLDNCPVTAGQKGGGSKTCRGDREERKRGKKIRKRRTGEEKGNSRTTYRAAAPGEAMIPVRSSIEIKVEWAI